MKGVGHARVFERTLGAEQRWLFERVTRLDDGSACSRDAFVDDVRWVREGRLPAARRIDVYRDAYVARLAECLADDYPAVAHALGPSEFRALCAGFIEAHPPTSSSLNFYGAPFAAFCATWPAAFAACVSDIARLEWAIVEAIHADAEVVLDAARLGAIPEADWDRARLVPSAALRVLDTAYPVHRHYRAFLDGDDPGLPELEASSVAVCRRGDDVWRIGLAAPFATLLGHLLNGLPLTSALDRVSAGDLAAGEPPAVADVQRVFSEWVACGFFAGIAFDGRPTFRVSLAS
jgi:hypothetical protein